VGRETYLKPDSDSDLYRFQVGSVFTGKEADERVTRQNVERNPKFPGTQQEGPYAVGKERRSENASVAEVKKGKYG